jgi:hypothetical protein
MRQLSRNTKSVIEEVVRSGRPAIVTVNGRPQVAVTPLVGAVEAVEEHVLKNAPAHIQAAVREGEADLVSGRAKVVDDRVFAELGDEERSAAELVAALAGRLDTDAVEEAIRSAERVPDPVAAVREALTQANVFAVGVPTEDVSASSQGAVDVVTYESDDDRMNVMLPVFTSVERGVVAEGAVGARAAGRLRLFRYEIRCWRDGVIPDVAEAVESPKRLSNDAGRARELLDLVRQVPTPVWGRDELRTGEMWNSNSLISWLITRSSLEVDAIAEVCLDPRPTVKPHRGYATSGRPTTGRRDAPLLGPNSLVSSRSLPTKHGFGASSRIGFRDACCAVLP